jgi:hypothetical protein
MAKMEIDLKIVVSEDGSVEFEVTPGLKVGNVLSAFAVAFGIMVGNHVRETGNDPGMTYLMSSLDFVNKGFEAFKEVAFRGPTLHA